jgi:sugar lactone lactonase YvrE
VPTAAATGMMWPVPRPRPMLAGLATLPALGAVVALTAGIPTGAGAAVGSGSGAGVRVQTIVGAGQLDTPGGLALDAAGDLFVADTGHCRVLMVPAESGVRYGVRLRTGRVATVAGGSCAGARSMGHPTGVAVDTQGDLFVAEATAQRVQEVRPEGPVGAATVAGTGQAGFNGDGLAAAESELDQPTSVALDASGDLFIADTANCRVRVLPAHDGTVFGRPVAAGHLFTAAGTGACGTRGQGGPAVAAQLWNPVAVAVDAGGNLLVADSGDQSVLVAAAHAGTFYGTAVAAGDVAVVVGGTGSYGPYLGDGLSATGPAAELNDPRGIALGPTGALFVSDGFMHAVRVVPSSTGTVLGRTMNAGDLYTAAGAVPVTSAAGLGDGTRWVLTHLGTPGGLAVSATGTLYVADATLDQVRAIGAS